MDKQMLIEIFGYVGSVLVVVSMLMSSIVKLRIINTIGSVISGTYALICGALPLVLMNACLIVINVVRLVKLLKTKQEYEFVDCSADDSMVKYFIEKHFGDITKYFPGFDKNDLKGKKAFVTMCEGAPAGITIGKVNNGTFDMDIDYTTPVYRDCSVAQFNDTKYTDFGITKLTYSNVLTEEHKAFLAKMGYTIENGKYVHNI